MPLKLNAFSGGSVTLNPASTVSDFTHTLPAVSGTVVTTGSSAVVTQGMLASGVAGNGPAFSAFQSSAQSALPANTITKLLFQTEEFDTNNNYDTSTSRFTPTVAGYYQINAAFTASTSYALGTIYLYKNGVQAKVGNSSSNSNNSNIWTISALVFMNGSTDFLEVHAFLSISQTVSATAALTYFQGFLARAV